MSGLIPQAEYLRVVRERDDLAERVAWFESQYPSPDDLDVLSVKAATRLHTIPARVLVMLYRSSPAVVSRSRIIQLFGWDVNDKNIDVHLHRIRAALKRLGAPPDAIHTHWGVGLSMTKEAHQWASEAILGAFLETTKTEEAAHERLTAAR
jgi:DNA-binding response OmpR family regulator